MKKTITLLILLTGSVFANATDTNDLTFPQAFDAWEASKSKDGWFEYLHISNDYNNENKIDEKDDCYSLSKEPVELITVKDRTGLITSVAVNIKNEKSKCFQKIFTGVQFPAPPFAPFYEHWRMR